MIPLLDRRRAAWPRNPSPNTVAPLLKRRASLSAGPATSVSAFGEMHVSIIAVNQVGAIIVGIDHESVKFDGYSMLSGF